MPETIPAAADHTHSFFAMITGSGPVVQAVLIILIILSIMSWAIAIAKLLHYRKARTDSEEFRTIFWETRNFARIDDSTNRLDASPLARLFSAGYHELSRSYDSQSNTKRDELGSVERILKRAELDESIKLERGLTFLATVATAAPFIGLFGTVWGIMNAFHGLSGPGAASTLQAVAPGISEALVATAIGLAAAIPASIAYNYFAVGMKHFQEAMDRFISDFLSLAKGA